MNYFTSLEFTNGMYVGVAFSSSTNAAVFRSKPYHDQAAALLEVNNYLRNHPSTDNQPIVNNATYTGPAQVATPPRKCCGR